MGKSITSGPFFVPLYLDGTSSLGVDYLLIGFKNIADRTSKVQVYVHVCKDPFLYPGISPEITIFHEKVKIPAGSCTVVRVDAGKKTFQGNNMLRVTIEGDTAEDAEAIVVALFGGSDSRPTPSMIFKHGDFIKLED